ncbi:unnamed protein product, partial [Prorocentrum cordatum]
ALARSLAAPRCSSAGALRAPPAEAKGAQDRRGVKGGAEKEEEEEEEGANKATGGTAPISAAPRPHPARELRPGANLTARRAAAAASFCFWPASGGGPCLAWWWCTRVATPGVAGPRAPPSAAQAVPLAAEELQALARAPGRAPPPPGRSRRPRSASPWA